jgi:hypothetical protein
MSDIHELTAENERLVAEVKRLRELCIPITDLVQELVIARQNLHHARAMGNAHFARAEAAEAERDSYHAQADALLAKHEGGSGAYWAEWHRTHCAAAEAGKAEVALLDAALKERTEERDRWMRIAQDEGVLVGVRTPRAEAAEAKVARCTCDE